MIENLKKFLDLTRPQTVASSVMKQWALGIIVPVSIGIKHVIFLLSESKGKAKAGQAKWQASSSQPAKLTFLVWWMAMWR